MAVSVTVAVAVAVSRFIIVACGWVVSPSVVIMLVRVLVMVKSWVMLIFRLNNVAGIPYVLVKPAADTALLINLFVGRLMTPTGAYSV